MTSENHYWSRRVVSRRALLHSAAFTGVGLTSAMLFGCKPAAQTTSSATNTPAAAAATAAVGTETPEWKKLVADAQKEGKLSFVVNNTDESKPVFDVFEKKFNIKVEYSTGNGAELLNRLLAERTAGRYTVDMASLGTSQIQNVFIPQGMLKPLRPEIILPDILDESKWAEGHTWWAGFDKDQKYILQYAAPVSLNTNAAGYNTKKVSPAEYNSINSVWDFLNPRWKGKTMAYDVAAVPAVWTRFLYTPGIGVDWLKRFFAEMEPVFFSDARIATDQLVAGAFDIGIGLGNGISDNLDVLKKQGAPVSSFNTEDKAKVWKEGGALTSTISNRSVSIMDKAPNPNAARLLANWLLSQEGQTQWNLHAYEGTPAAANQSLRSDVKEMGRTDPVQRRQTGVKYIRDDQFPGFDGTAGAKLVTTMFTDYQAKKK